MAGKVLMKRYDFDGTEEEGQMGRDRWKGTDEKVRLEGHGRDETGRYDWGGTEEN